jgi:HPt (histidine-containing phosphotransfer) domain-containing protein
MDSRDRGGAIDRQHLQRMTSGDRGLEQEVLCLFDRQAALLIERMRDSNARAIGALAHTLKGSAVGIGAGRVASAAEAAERVAAGASGDGGQNISQGRSQASNHASGQGTSQDSSQDISQAIDRLAEAVDDARALIAVLVAET